MAILQNFGNSLERVIPEDFSETVVGFPYLAV
jgi:hypothetical protein